MRGGRSDGGAISESFEIETGKPAERGEEGGGGALEGGMYRRGATANNASTRGRHGVGAEGREGTEPMLEDAIPGRPAEGEHGQGIEVPGVSQCYARGRDTVSMDFVAECQGRGRHLPCRSSYERDELCVVNVRGMERTLCTHCCKLWKSMLDTRSRKERPDQPDLPMMEGYEG